VELEEGLGLELVGRLGFGAGMLTRVWSGRE